ncbi:MAG: chromosome segregation protein SMC [Rhodospirillaceae bacterium]|nr:chromosome segregation protein SMC [Rhodospirillaceae bacterium]
MVQFTRVRLTGFKSFVDPTELDIAPGLTGVVGPNGCGKSNILEAIRWCMGEGSARQLRGGGMDDVIFSGTSDRPARNIAEVSIELDNHQKDAPTAVNEFDQITVTRRIERDSGSNYKVNNQDARARDVQLLFADLQTGARSTGIVSQGKIAAIVAAKTVERRTILEEAAGITGLHSRRHEAELRLKAAETNLDRLEDVMTALASQMQSFKRQARQAARYRNISRHIRQTEAALLHLRWTEAIATHDAACQDRDRIAEEVETLTRAAAALSERSAGAGAALLSLRDGAAKADAARHRHLVERDNLAAEAQRLAERQNELSERLKQVDQDIAREEVHLADAKSTVDKLEKEVGQLRADAAGDDAARMAAAEAAQRADAAVDAFEKEFRAATEQAAAREAQRASARDRVDALVRSVNELSKRIQVQETQRDALATAEAEPRLEEARRLADEAEAVLIRRRTAAEAAERFRDAKAEAVERTRVVLQAESDELTRLNAEAETLHALLARVSPDEARPVIEDIRVTASYEAALGAALGDDLEAPIDETAAIRWRSETGDTDEGPPLPQGAKPLSWFVKAPSALDRRLDQIAVVDDLAQLEALAPELAQGQRAVSRDGGLVRWDGFVVAAGAPTAAAQRLAQQNRLDSIGRETVAANRRVTAAQSALDDARNEAETAAESWRQANASVRDAFDQVNACRNAAASLSEAVALRRTRLETVVEALGNLVREREEAQVALTQAETAQAEIPEDADAQAQLERMRADLAALRRNLSDKERARHRLESEAASRAQRLKVVEDDIGRWRGRSEGSDAQMVALLKRRAEVIAEIDREATAPDDLAACRAAADALVTESEGACNRAAAAVAEAESSLAGIDRDLREAERVLADTRESRGRTDGLVAQSEQMIAQLRDRCREHLNCAPEALPEMAVNDGSKHLPSVEDAGKRLERLLRERDGMGPVNHRAEQEAKEVEEQIETYQREREDLIAAIEKFRRAIAALNREGRERLLASFETVNGHFRSLFARLYGGGRAHLTLTEADDPLNSGLEIMASPPGKRLQSLSLLSGGEQALTAIALLFAVFLTNPAPICILDEVDAPLDDSNVDRFCTLVEDIAEETGTRFLIVTHHRLTMARMDRLYGVTMAERGVSQLVSVDLRAAEAMRETA